MTDYERGLEKLGFHDAAGDPNRWTKDELFRTRDVRTDPAFAWRVLEALRSLKAARILYAHYFLGWAHDCSVLHGKEEVSMTGVLYAAVEQLGRTK